MERQADCIPSHSLSVYDEDDVGFFHVPFFEFVEGFFFFRGFFVVEFGFEECEYCEFESYLAEFGYDGVAFDDVVFKHSSSSGYGGLRNAKGFGKLSVASMAIFHELE